jgi:predicted aldo/keto reductase-like oxidoreductase
MLEYSAFFPWTEPLIELANKHDVGVIVMRPLGGSGRMSFLRNKMSATEGEFSLTPARLLTYVLSNPHVSVAIPGARYPSRVRANVDVALTYERLDDAQRSECEQEAKRLFDE